MFRRVGLACLFLIGLAGCSSSEKLPDATAPTAGISSPSWSSQMQQLSMTLSDLVPYVFDDRKFNDPQNFEIIETKTKQLAEFAHTLEPSKKDSAKNGPMSAVNAPNSDPALKFFAAQFKDDLNRAHESLRSDHRVYARSVIKTSMSYCISCHTRSDQGPKFNFSPNSDFVKSMQPIERARYFTATRQFEPALKEFLKILEDPNTGKSRPFDIEKAARSALAIAVRVNQDPDQSLRIAKEVISKPSTPIFVKNDADTWVTAILSWKKESKVAGIGETALRNHIKDLIRRAESVQRYQADMKGDVYYLRATALIHDYFNRFSPKDKDAGELYFLAGTSYEALKDLGFWSLHEMYFERCIRTTPHTPMARKCYEAFEQSILLGYSGSAGLFLPTSVANQLDELRGLAVVK